MRALATAIALLAVVPRASDACSKRAYFDPVIGGRMAMILGTATADTLKAGAQGMVRTSMFSRVRTAFAGDIYGHVIVVDSSIGPGATSAKRVVIVPWDYGADCSPLPYSGSAAWRPAGTRGLYRAELRDSQYWVNGMPTYDVHTPQFEPYMDQRGGAGAKVPLSPEELFSVARHFASSHDDKPGLLRFLKWARENPAIASRDPLPRAISSAEYAVGWVDLAALDIPVRGTWRVVTKVARDSVVVYARTDERATTWWDPADPGGGQFVLPKGPIKGYSIVISLGTVASAISGNSRQSYLYVPVLPKTESAGTRTWSGLIQTDMPKLVFGTGSISSAVAQLGELVPASFTIDAKGNASFEHRSTLRDGRSVVIRGTRISMEAGR